MDVSPDRGFARDAPCLMVSMPFKSWEIRLAGAPITIGRSPQSDVHLDDPSVSRLHARIDRDGDRYVLRDLGSRNGVWLGSTRVQERILQDGDSVRIGSARLVFEHEAARPELTVTATLTSLALPSPPEVEIQLDQAKLNAQVEQIAESDLFKHLEAMTRKLKRSRQ